MLKQIELCNECNACLEVCPVYLETRKEVDSPLSRLKNAKRIFSSEEVSWEVVESYYNDPMCGLCDFACPSEIKISEIIKDTRRELVTRGLAPLDGHKKIIASILERGNSIEADPNKRLEWLPEPFVDRESDTLLYLGCLSSYLVKESATASYLLLKKAGVDFRILRDEGCCGVYLYDTGKRDLAEKLFRENATRFKELGIKKIIVPCAGCYTCFKHYYPNILGRLDFEVYHIVDIIQNLIESGTLKLKPINAKMTYHDPCRLGRRMGKYDEPRQILEACGAMIIEMEKNREQASCCGAGGGVRSVFRDLSLSLAIRALELSKTDTIVSSCPFCIFNFRWASRKKMVDRKIQYIAEVVLEATS
jgi:heterodisulfide reductase subunit D